MRSATRFFAGACLLLMALSASAADWPQFRGPGGLGHSSDTKLPVTWSAKDNVAWRTDLPGQGASSPIVVGGKVFLTCYSGYGLDAKQPGNMDQLTLHFVGLDRASGKLLFNKEIKPDLPEQGFTGPFITLHGYSSSTPVSDGKSVYVFFGKTGVIAFDLDGKQLWKSSAGTRTHGWGSGTSPILAKDLVIVNASVESGSLVALNKADGKTAWTAKGMNASWNTPLLVDVDGKSEVVVSVQGKLLAFDPPTGNPLWNCSGIPDYVCPSVVAHAGVVYAIGGRSNTAIAVKAGGKGDVTSQILWKISKGSNVSSPVYHDGHLYWAHEGRGVVYCVDVAKGTVVYEERLTPNPDRIYGSPVAADGKLYYVSRTTGTYVVEAGPKFKQLANNKLDSDAGVFNGSAVIHDGQILLRSNRYLYCIGKK